MDAEALREPAAQRIGPYEILIEIGSGGMGTISLARATGEPLGVDGFARLVAIKRPQFGGAPDHEVMSRFLDEARLLAQIHHANVVGIHQIGADAGGHFLVLDYVEGGALDDLCTRAALRLRRLPPPVVLRILGDVLAGLHAVHEAVGVEGRALGMLHRDVSMQNVLVGRDGVARLADFGIAKAITSTTVTDKAYLHGRLPYLTPEYLRRDAVDRRIDVYAAGVTMWSALAGRVPWDGATEAQIVHELLHVGVPPLSAAGVTIAPDIQAIVSRACQRDREARYPSARAMLDALEDLGRRTGWLASHAEVAALVEELLGVELRERRAALARRLSPPSAPAPPAPPGGIPAVQPAASLKGSPGAAAGASSGAAAAAAPATSAPRRSGMAAAIALLAALGAALAVWRWSAPGASADNHQSTAAAPAPPAPLSSSSSTAPPSSLSTQAVIEAPPAASAPPSASSTSKGAQGLSARPPSRPSSTPAGLPTGISTVNPYRPR